MIGGVGMLVSLEGLPGAGKSTQGRLLEERLRSEGLVVAFLPDLATLDTGDVGTTLVEIFSSSDDPFLRHGDVVTECLLAAAVRADIVATRIEPALDHHDVVIEDRGVHTMFSYGLASLIRQHAVEVDDAVSWLDGLGRLAGRRADVVLWLSAPVGETIARAEARDGRQWTGEQRAYLSFVDLAYQELAARDTGMMRVPTAGQAPEAVHAAVWEAVAAQLKRSAKGTSTRA
ncbi:thymidylate kinase [Frankia sp. B2]|uniref:dTMP kinase n=1 Tax=Frankia sp. B2 TaxID=2541730 RepID=UPI001F0E02BF|nr:thymidylate kinase [Frankia sp. B2]